MKMLNINIRNLAGVFAFVAMLTLLYSCKEDSLGTAEEPSGPPSLERVRGIAQDTTVTEGNRGEKYAIVGENLATTETILFSGVEAYFNPTLVTNSNIIIQVPVDAPFRDASNTLTVKTLGGTAELPFTIQQPPPEINNFSPQVAGAGEVITITGSVFDNVESVYFVTATEEVQAEIVSSSKTEIKVRIPEGIIQAQIAVVTPGGRTVAQSSFGFKYLVYDDALNSNWYEGSWNSAAILDNTEHVKRGSYAIKKNYGGGYTGFKVHVNDTSVDLADYSALKISIYGGTGAGDIKVVINGNYDAGKVVTLTEGEWTNFTMPFSKVGNHSSLSEIVLQEFSGSSFTIYIDDIGLI